MVHVQHSWSDHTDGLRFRDGGVTMGLKVLWPIGKGIQLMVPGLEL